MRLLLYGTPEHVGSELQDQIFQRTCALYIVKNKKDKYF